MLTTPSHAGWALFSVSLLARLTLADGCGPSYTVCAPAGATATSLPPTGPQLLGFYPAVLESVKGLHWKRSEGQNLAARDATSLCCYASLDCVNLQSFNVPFCYDPFTTDFSFPGGQYGTIYNGSYSAPDAVSANLLNGVYSLKNGESGDIYQSSALNTATLPFPTPYTASGVGGAIPATALGQLETVTVTVAATTISAQSIPATTEILTSYVMPTAASPTQPSSGSSVSTAAAQSTSKSSGAHVRTQGGVLGTLFMMAMIL